MSGKKHDDVEPGEDQVDEEVVVEAPVEEPQPGPEATTEPEPVEQPTPVWQCVEPGCQRPWSLHRRCDAHQRSRS